MSFTKSRRCVGREICEFWIKIAFSLGLTGSSSLAALRFSLACRVLENSLKFIVPVTPRPDQKLVAEGLNSNTVLSSIATTIARSSGPIGMNMNLGSISEDSMQLVAIPKTEYDGN